MTQPRCTMSALRYRMDRKFALKWGQKSCATFGVAKWSGFVKKKRRVLIFNSCDLTWSPGTEPRNRTWIKSLRSHTFLLHKKSGTAWECAARSPNPFHLPNHVTESMYRSTYTQLTNRETLWGNGYHCHITYMFTHRVSVKRKKAGMQRSASLRLRTICMYIAQ